MALMHRRCRRRDAASHSAGSSEWYKGYRAGNINRQLFIAKNPLKQKHLDR